MNTTQTQAQQFAAAHAAGQAKAMLRTIRVVRWLATAIMIAAMVSSYGHQAMYLTHKGAPAIGAWVIPGVLDALTAICVKVTGTAAMVRSAKVMALRVLVFPALASGAINFVAPGALVTKLGFVAVVLAIPAAELVASAIKPDFAALDALERATLADAAPVASTPRNRKPAADRVFEARMLHPTANIATIARMAKVAPATAKRVLASVPTSPAHATLVGSAKA